MLSFNFIFVLFSILFILEKFDKAKDEIKTLKKLDYKKLSATLMVYYYVVTENTNLNNY